MAWCLEALPPQGSPASGALRAFRGACWLWPFGALPVALALLSGGLPRGGMAPAGRGALWARRAWILALAWASLALAWGASSWSGLVAGALALLGAAWAAAVGWRVGRGGLAGALGLLRALAWSGALASGLAVMAWALLRAGLWPEPWAAWLSGGTGDRAAFPLGHPNQLAAALLLPWAATLALACQGGRWAWLLPPLALAFFASGSRAGLLGAALVLALVLGRQAQSWGQDAARLKGAKASVGSWAWWVAGGLLVLALGSLLALDPWWFSRWAALNPKHPSFDVDRLGAWAQAWHMLAQRPLLGCGPEAWALRPKLWVGWPLPHPHQAYLHLALAFGALPALLLGALGFGAAWRGWRLPGPQAWPIQALASVLLAWCLMAFVDEALAEARLALLACALGAYLWALPQAAAGGRGP